MKHLTAIDLFCGIGGFSTGFINAGWHVVAAMDADIDALATYYVNLCDEDTKLIGNFSKKDMKLIEGARKDWRLFDSGGYEAVAGPGYRKSSIYHENQEWTFRDMLPVSDEWMCGIPPAVNALFYKKAQDITGYEIIDAVSEITHDEQIGVVMGGPPCQGFSCANKNRHSRDTRNFLVFEFGRLVMEINPMTFVMENVPAIQNMKLPDGSNLIETFMKMVNEQDWDTYYEVQAMFMDGNMDPEGECTVIPQEQESIQRTLCQ